MLRSSTVNAFAMQALQQLSSRLRIPKPISTTRARAVSGDVQPSRHQKSTSMARPGRGAREVRRRGRPPGRRLAEAIRTRYHYHMPVALALGSALLYGIADYCGGRASRSAPSILVSLIGQLTGLFAALTVVLVIGTPWPPIIQLLWGVTAGVATAFSLAAFYRALSLGSMTVVAPITAVLSAVLPVTFGFLRGERPAPLVYGGIALAVAAIALVSGAFGHRPTISHRTAIRYAALAGFGFALIFIALGETTRATGIWPVVISRVVSVALWIGVLATTRVRLDASSSVRNLAAAAGLLDISANVLYLFAVRRGLLSIVVVIAALYPVSTVALALTLDKERVSRAQVVGMVMAVGALVVISVG
jgi:drug/metabolite transporter (DMT)-like permease